MKPIKVSLAAGVLAAGLTFGVSMSAHAAGSAPPAPAQHWSFSGLFGTFDRGALRRGFQVYTEVCATCHGLRLIAYRNLMEIGFSENEVKAIAAEVEVQDGPDDEGEMFDRPGKPSDRLPSPFANENAARAANNGANPPDLSLMVKARPDGANYTHALLALGYEEFVSGEAKQKIFKELTDKKMKAYEAELEAYQAALDKGKSIPKPVEPKPIKSIEDMGIGEGLYFNAFFPGYAIAMAPPLSEDSVEFADGTKATVKQQVSDVTTFLAWAAEPELEDRKRMGVKVILFLLLLTGMLYVVKRRIWADVH